jgi:DNA-binding CsgD family transcriptional regulator
MEELKALTGAQVARPPTSPPSMNPVQSASTYQADPHPTLSDALEASLRLTASLLAQSDGVDVMGQPVIDLDLGGYHWTVSRCVRDASGVDLQLSPRELEIVRMVARGLTNRAIASALDISPWTVGTYLRRVFGKLEVNSRAAMVARAIELGLHPGTEDVQPGASLG